MKMILAIVQERDSARLIEALVGRQFHVTKLAGMGGLGNATVLIGVEEHQADDVLRLIEDVCQQGERVVRGRTVRGGGATVFSGSWAVRAEAGAPSPPIALCQIGAAEFPALSLNETVYSAAGRGSDAWTDLRAAP
jgi:uncharacterized protein YaaQ